LSDAYVTQAGKGSISLGKKVSRASAVRLLPKNRISNPYALAPAAGHHFHWPPGSADQDVLDASMVRRCARCDNKTDIYPDVLIVSGSLFV
jgi:hypothetical protein